MQASFLVQPCPELLIEVQEFIHLKTPWLQLLVEGDEITLRLFGLWMEQGLSTLERCQSIFHPLLRYPVCSSLPRSRLGPAHSLAEVEPLPSEIHGACAQFFDTSPPIAMAMNDEGKIDALALLTQQRIIRFRRRAQRSRYNLAQVKSHAKAHDTGYTAFLAELASHGLSITRRGILAIATASDHWREARPQLLGYLKDETGHDQLVASSYQKLTHAPDEADPGDAVRISLDLLQYAARNSPLAFMMALDVFECIPYTQGDLGLWDILDTLHAHQASHGIRRHRSINHINQHSNIAWELAYSHASYECDEAQLAWLLADAIDQLLLNSFHSELERFMSYAAPPSIPVL